MDMSRFNQYLSLIWVFLASIVFCDRTSQKIYVDLTTFGMCFRRMNGTHQIGCTSEQGGNVGVLHQVKDINSLEWLINSGPHQPYVILMTPETFTRDNVMRLKAKDGLVAGILVSYINVTDEVNQPADGFSPDTQCPNGEHDMYSKDAEYKDCSQVIWNPTGNGLMYEDYNFPIAVLYNYTEVQFLTECYVSHNEPTVTGTARDYPLCAIEMKDAMDGAKDTPTCMRRSSLINNLNPDDYCDPLGDYSIYGFSKLLKNTEPLQNRSVIVASARLDSFSMYDHIYPSADSAVSGVVTLIAAAEALAQVEAMKKDSALPILYTLLNGEAFDYIGSARLVYEMKKSRFPHDIDPNKDEGPSKVELHHLKSFVEVSQVGLPSSSSSLYLHTDPITRKHTTINTQIEEIVSKLETEATSAGLTATEDQPDLPLPPASLQTFLKAYIDQNQLPIPGVVIADHAEAFENKFYNSRYDLASIMGLNYPEGLNETEQYHYSETDAAQKITKVATMLARTLFKMSTNEEPASNLAANQESVAHLLYCLLKSPQCELYEEILTADNAKNLAPRPYPLYVGVSVSGSTARNQVTTLMRNVLAYFTGRLLTNETEGSCTHRQETDKYYHYIWAQGAKGVESEKEREAICIETTTFYTEAKSPAFLLDDYSWSSKQYSTWTESRWGSDAFSVRAFLKPSPHEELAVLIGGIVMLLVSMVAMLGISKRAGLLFIVEDSISTS